jgi:hypothetical protein
VWASYLGFLWYWTRLFTLAPSERKRFNLLGAINAVTHKLITVANHDVSVQPPPERGHLALNL